MILARVAALILGLSVLAACQKSDLQEPPVPMGDFVLGLNIVVADNVQKVPISRDATPEEWKVAMTKAVSDRFGRYSETGTKFYNLGISVDGYALAPPGIPVVLKPRSVLVITANIWDDAAQKKLNPEGKQITVFEKMSGATVVGSGLTQSKEKQMEILSYNAVKAVENWLLDNPEWFGLPPKRTPTPADAPTVVSPRPAGETAAAAAGAVTTTGLPPAAATP